MIFLKGEEITFDYNVDRYGADAQPCYCGEPSCVGILGGKTQTEAVNKLPQPVLDALDMDDSDEDTWMTSKKNHTKKKPRLTEDELDEDFDIDEEDDYETKCLAYKASDGILCFEDYEFAYASSWRLARQ